MEQASQHTLILAGNMFELSIKDEFLPIYTNQ